MAIRVNTVLAKKAMATAIKAGLVVMLTGSPGIGKSDIVQDVANDFSLELIDIRLAQCEPPDLGGFPCPDMVRQRAAYLPFDTFPLEGDTLPAGKQGWLIFLDEFNSADRSVQKAAYKLLLNRMVGQFKLHPNVVIVCAGNLDTDNALVEEMSSALESRLIHLELEIDHLAWLDWGRANQLDHRILAHIRQEPANLSSFDPKTNSDQKTYACPRTWYFGHKLLQHMDIDDDECLPLLAGTISEGPARKFLSYIKVYQFQPSIDDIVRDPCNTAVPDNPGALFAMIGTLALSMDALNAAPLMAYLERFPLEFQIICLMDVSRKDNSLIHLPPIKKWIAANNTAIF